MSKFIPTCYGEEYAKKNDERHNRPIASVNFDGVGGPKAEKLLRTSDSLAYNVNLVIRTGRAIDESSAYQLVTAIIQHSRVDLAKKLLNDENCRFLCRYPAAKENLEGVIKNPISGRKD